jgi:hypothetical protein
LARLIGDFLVEVALYSICSAPLIGLKLCRHNFQETILIKKLQEIQYFNSKKNGDLNSFSVCNISIYTPILGVKLHILQNYAKTF